jgi:hypothetical protein
MRRGFCAACAALAALMLAATPALAQAEAVPTDLNGVWTNASLTTLSRPAGVSKLVLTPEEAAALVERVSIAGFAPEGAPVEQFSDPDAGAPEAGSGDFGVKAYDQFWVAPGDRLAVVKGEIRSSNIIDPPDGRVPLRPDAEVRRTSGRYSSRYVSGIGGNEGPEALPLSERCLIGFGNTGGPGMLSTLYNNTYRFVQAPDHVMILVEMVHDARIIPTFASAEEARASHRPGVLQRWLGDSVGWYEGKTLVVETRHIRPEQVQSSQIPVSSTGRITERFSRISENEIHYQFEVEDPANYSRPWTAELSFYPGKGGLFEYACHEGNYAMANILGGARLQEAQETARAKPVRRRR